MGVTFRRMKWTGHVGCMREMRKSYKLLELENQKGNLGIDVRISLKLIIKKDGLNI